MLGVVIDQPKLLASERAGERDPARVQGFHEGERDFDGVGAGVGELRGSPFVVGTDGGFGLGEGGAHAATGVNVAVGDVVNDLAEGQPSSR